MGFGVWGFRPVGGLGFRVSGFMVSGFGFRVSALWGVSGLGSRVGWFRVSGLGVLPCGVVGV